MGMYVNIKKKRGNFLQENQGKFKYLYSRKIYQNYCDPRNYLLAPQLLLFEHNSFPIDITYKPAMHTFSLLAFYWTAFYSCRPISRLRFPLLNSRGASGWIAIADYRPRNVIGMILTTAFVSRFAISRDLCIISKAKLAVFVAAREIFSFRDF